ncbi:DUF3152 domain-containing protein [Actinomadura hibisca]|uniref:DUF3152 domain-containing protein n=1 Tax=Actinomadura hibisca TaxID=68565 RepID=UPI000ABC0186|nr:DUF3152 domain-containing protein [Actinomadura hibisca]
MLACAMQPQRPRAGRRRASSGPQGAPPPRDPADHRPGGRRPSGHDTGGHAADGPDAGARGPGGRQGGGQALGGYGPGGYGPGGYGPGGQGPGGQGPGGQGPGGHGPGNQGPGGRPPGGHEFGGPEFGGHEGGYEGGYEPGPYEGGGYPQDRPVVEDAFSVGAEHGISGDLERAFEGARRERARQVIFSVVAVAVVVAVGAGGFVAWATLDAKTPADQEVPAEAPEARPSGHADKLPSEPAVVPPRKSVYIPTRGTGTFSRPIPGKRVYGRGKPLRYMVQVEGGLRQSSVQFTLAVDRVLADPRGWTAGGKWAFQRVASGPYDFVVKLASPGTTDKLCGAYGLTTEGKVNCSAGKQVVVNLKRWLLLTTYYRGQSDLYHALVINHEVGHRLGVKHMTCPGAGRPAPVMQQQIFGLKGCRINGWPYDQRGRFLSGPVVP